MARNRITSIFEVQARSRHAIQDLLDLLGRRWALRILWELRGPDPRPFNELHRACGEMSTSVLTTRLNELTEARIVERGRRGYALTAQGRELLGHLEPLNAFANRWRPA